MPVLKAILATHRERIHGIIHCSGGAQTKVQKFLKNKRVVKNNLLPIPYLFNLIQSESGTDWKEMYQVFNMGHRLEIYLKSEDASAIIEYSKSFGIDAQVVGYVEEWKGEAVRIESEHGSFDY